MESQAKQHYIGKLYGGNLIELKDPPETNRQKSKSDWMICQKYKNHKFVSFGLKWV